VNTKKCSWSGNYDQIKNHLREEHSNKCYDYAEQELSTVKEFRTVGFYFKFLFAFNEVFFQRFHTKDDILYVSVYYVGHTENVGKYKYKVEFLNTDNTEGVSVMRLISNFSERMNLGTCGKLLYDEVSHLTNESGDLNYKIEILGVGD
jgi:hypothetical protein